MRLHGPQSSFELALAGRPGPDGWCPVRVVVRGPDGDWSASARCLRGDEVPRLADWLETTAAAQALSASFDTCDGVIAFEILAGEPRLRVYLEEPLRPVRARLEPWREFFRDFPVTEHGLRQAAAALRGQLEQATKRDRRPRS
jgi:hypothetical protein